MRWKVSQYFLHENATGNSVHSCFGSCSPPVAKYALLSHARLGHCYFTGLMDSSILEATARHWPDQSTKKVQRSDFCRLCCNLIQGVRKFLQWKYNFITISTCVLSIYRLWFVWYNDVTTSGKVGSWTGDTFLLWHSALPWYLIEVLPLSELLYF